MRQRSPSPLPRQVYLAHRVLAVELREAAEARARAGGTPVKFNTGSGRVLAEIGAPYGLSHVSVAKILAVYEAAQADPARYGALAERMERGSIDGAYRRLRRMQDEARVLGLAPVAGRFRTLVLDPPWDTDGLSASCGPDYA